MLPRVAGHSPGVPSALPLLAELPYRVDMTTGWQGAAEREAQKERPMDRATTMTDQIVRCARFALLTLVLVTVIAGSQASAFAQELRQVSPDAETAIDHRIGRPAFSLSQIDHVQDHDLIDRLPNVVGGRLDLRFRFDVGLDHVVEIRSGLIGSCLELCGDRLDAVHRVA